MAGRTSSMSPDRSDFRSRSPRGRGGHDVQDDDYPQQRAEVRLRHAKRSRKLIFDRYQVARNNLNTSTVSLSNHVERVKLLKTKEAKSIKVAREAWKRKERADSEARTATEAESQAKEAQQKAKGKVEDMRQHKDTAAQNLQDVESSLQAATEAEQRARAKFDVDKENQRQARVTLATADMAKQDASLSKMKCRTSSSRSEALSAEAHAEAGLKLAKGDPTGEDGARQATDAVAGAKRACQQADTACNDAERHAKKQRAAHDEATAMCNTAEEIWKNTSADLETWEQQALTARGSFKTRQRHHEEAVLDLEAAEMASSRTSSNANAAQTELKLQRNLADTYRAAAEADGKLVAAAEREKEEAIADVNAAQQTLTARETELREADEAVREAEECVNSFISR